MGLDEVLITRAIVERFTEKFLEHVDLEVAIVGGGVSGLTAGWRLAQRGHKVAIFERKLSVGGGMMFNEIVIQEVAKPVLDELGIRVRPIYNGYYTADAVEAVTTLASRAVKAGATVFNCISVEDVMVREDRVTGLVIAWTAAEMARLHVDPLVIRAQYTIDATGHDLEVVKVLLRKNQPLTLFTPSGGIGGERSMWSEEGEKGTIDNTGEIYPGFFVAGMAATATFGVNRMGAIFGGMLLSGLKAAELIHERLTTTG
jgi:thiazole biosynthesis enzyme